MHAGPYATGIRLDTITARSVARECAELYRGCEYIDRVRVNRDAVRLLSFARGVAPLGSVERELARFETLPTLSGAPRLALILRACQARRALAQGRAVRLRDAAELASLCPRYVRRRKMLEGVAVTSSSPRLYDAEGVLTWLRARLTKRARH